MAEYKIGDEIWIISFEIEDDFYLLSRQTVVEVLEDNVECEDDFNTFHVSFEDIYKTKADALKVMISKLQTMQKEH